MQTFLCEPTFSLSLAHLDYKRLGKQRVEAYQILLALGDEWSWSVYTGSKTPETYGWKHHPAVKMWSGYETQLKIYHDMCIGAWLYLGYSNNMPLAFADTLNYRSIPNPIWYTKEFIMSHRCKLLQKNYNYYSKYNWIVPNNWQDVNYIWPVKCM